MANLFSTVLALPCSLLSHRTQIPFEQNHCIYINEQSVHRKYDTMNSKNTKRIIQWIEKHVQAGLAVMHLFSYSFARIFSICFWYAPNDTKLTNSKEKPTKTDTHCIKLSYFLFQRSNLKLECKFDVGSQHNENTSSNDHMWGWWIKNHALHEIFFSM